MKLWQGLMAFPLGVAAAGVTYDLYKRIVGTMANSSVRSEETVSSAMVASAGKMIMPFHPRIAVVELFGSIYGGARISELVGLLDALRSDARVKSVVLEVDCPGGSAPACHYLYRSVSRLASRKPVIAFVRGVGASGGYMVSCAATKIIAMPSSIVGSIGVILVSPVLKDLLKRLGIEMSVTKSGPFKDMGAFYREATEEEDKKKQELIDEFYQEFVELVARSRSMTVDEVRDHATGEIFTAKKAKEYGLVDDVGDMESALDLAAQLGRVPRRVVYVRPRRPLMQRLMSRFAASMAEEIRTDLDWRLGTHVYY